MAGKNIKGITIEIDGNATGLDKALKGVNSTSVKLNSELGQVNKLLKLAKVFSGQGKDGEIDLQDISYENMGLVDFEVLYNFIWVLAKTADKTIPEPLEWLDGFDSMPIADIFPEISELLQSSIESKKK